MKATEDKQLAKLRDWELSQNSFGYSVLTGVVVYHPKGESGSIARTSQVLKLKKIEGRIIAETLNTIYELV